MNLINRLKEDLYNLRKNYRNGRERKILLERRRALDSAIESGFQGDEFYEGLVRVDQRLSAIPEPRGFLEGLAYTLGSRPKKKAYSTY